MVDSHEYDVILSVEQERKRSGTMAVLGSEDEGGDGGRVSTRRVGKARKDLHLRNLGKEALG